MIELYNDDCLNILKTIPNESIHLVVTDPPYRITSRGSSGNTGGMFQKEINKNGRVFEYNDITPPQYAPELYRVLRQNTHCYVMCNHVNLIDMLNVFTSVGFGFVKSLIWDKGNKINGKFYMSQFEYILLFRKGGERIINNCGTSDIISIRNIKHKNLDGTNIHDSEKPVELMQCLIENSSDETEIVLDPFVGSGSTAVACLNSYRNFIGIEIDKKYYDIAQARVQNKPGIIVKKKSLI